MQIDVALVPSQARAWRGCVCIVIDELRASSTITTLLDLGCPDLFLAATLTEARRVAAAKGAWLVGERHGRTPRRFDFNNSPAELRRASLDGRPAVLSTTNGTLVLGRLRHQPVVLVGCLLNALACAEAAAAIATARGYDIGIVCAGTRGRFALDDAVAAGEIVRDLIRLVAAEPAPRLGDAALGVVRLRAAYTDPTEALAMSTAGRLVTSLGAADDVTVCAELDHSRTVPLLRPGPPLSIVPYAGDPDAAVAAATTARLFDPWSA